ncbi:MAG: hypothetical protein SFY92_05865 [Verrucomicrobiae bacterium]|nr:hypothetical protein [Verrucomicrobiae bacterium]
MKSARPIPFCARPAVIILLCNALGLALGAGAAWVLHTRQAAVTVEIPAPISNPLPIPPTPPAPEPVTAPPPPAPSSRAAEVRMEIKKIKTQISQLKNRSDADLFDTEELHKKLLEATDEGEREKINQQLQTAAANLVTDQKLLAAMEAHVSDLETQAARIPATLPPDPQPVPPPVPVTPPAVSPPLPVSPAILSQAAPLNLTLFVIITVTGGIIGLCAGTMAAVFVSQQYR